MFYLCYLLKYCCGWIFLSPMDKLGSNAHIAKTVIREVFLLVAINAWIDFINFMHLTIILHYIPLYSIILHYTPLYSIILHYTPLYLRSMFKWMQQMYRSCKLLFRMRCWLLHVKYICGTCDDPCTTCGDYLG